MVYPAEFFKVDYFVLMSKCKAGENGKADLETLYDVEMYEIKDEAEKMYISSQARFDDDYEFNVFLLIKRTKLEKIVNTLRQLNKGEINS